jgi:hypothetical protein
MLAAMALLVVPIIVLGLRPQILLFGAIAPGLHAWGLPSELLDHYIAVQFLSPADIMSFVYALGIGILIFVVGMRFGLFHLRAPAWFGVNYWYIRAAEGFLVACRLTAEWYDRYLAAVSKALRSARGHYRSGWARGSRDWQRFVVTLTTGAPGPRNQHFIERAYVVLERERQSTVRAALAEASALSSGAHPDASPARPTEMLNATRDVATYIAGRLMATRMAVLSEMVRTGEIDGVRSGFDRAVRELRRFRLPVAEAAIALAERRMSGVTVARDMSAVASRILHEERFDIRLREAAHAQELAPVPGTVVASATESARGVGRLEETAHWLSEVDLRPKRQVRGLGRLELAAQWLTGILRIVVMTLTQERSSWLVAEHLDAETIVSTRYQIQRYARDMSFNVAVVVIVLLVVLASIATGGSP